MRARPGRGLPRWGAALAVCVTLAAAQAAGSVEVPRPKPDRPVLPVPKPMQGTGGVSLAVPLPRPAPEHKASAAARDGPAARADSLTLTDGRSCEQALRRLGVRFERRQAIREGACGARRPLSVTGVGAIALSRPATMRCPAAHALARWVREVLEPAARRHLRAGVEGLRVAASYACRTRRNGRGSNRLSEHALANAIDISAVMLSGGQPVPVRPRGAASRQGRFQAAIRKGACARFTTVLGPGSDGVHEDHFHFDLARRRSGYRLCR